MTAKWVALGFLKVVAVLACLCCYYFTFGIILILPGYTMWEQIRDAVILLTTSAIMTLLTVLLFRRTRKGHEFPPSGNA